MTTGEWISTKDRLPECGKINGFWDEVPVIVKKKGNPRPFGAGFTYHGGDDVYPDDHPLPKFSVDCGMGIPDITHWMEMPEPPKDPLVGVKSILYRRKSWQTK